MRPFEEQVNEAVARYQDVGLHHGMDRALREAVEMQVYLARERIEWQQIIAKLEAERDALKAHLAKVEAGAAKMREALEAYDPPMPPRLEDESDEAYTNRLLGAYGMQTPYKERRFRQCSIGYHDECSDPEGERCQCPCHQFGRLREAALASSAGRETSKRLRLLEAVAEAAEPVYQAIERAWEQVYPVLHAATEDLVDLREALKALRALKGGDTDAGTQA